MAKHPHDNLFEGSTMTFGEHIEELRSALFQSLLGLGVAFVITLFFAGDVVRFIESPLRRSLEDYYRAAAKKRLAEQFGGPVPPEMMAVIEEERMLPKKTHVEVGSLLTSLKQALPEEFRGIEFNPYAFRTSDLTPEQAVALARRWKAGAEKKETPEHVIWSLLSPPQRSQVKQVAARDKPGAGEAGAMTGLLNAVASRPELHRAAEFAKVKNTQVASEADLKAIRDQLAASFNEDQSRRLNRLLLSSRYADLLRRPRLTLVEAPIWEVSDVRTQTLNPHEAFMIWIKSAVVVGIVVAAPWMFVKIWGFVAAGLYPHERRYVYIYLPISIALFLGGVAIAFFFVFEYVLDFLLGFNLVMNIDPMPRISEYLNFVLLLPLAFGLSFQLPLVMLFLQRIGLFTVEQYLEKWRIAILVIFVISMVLTPADPISMMLMALPLTGLYFGGVAMCRWMPEGRNPFADAQPYEP